VPHHSPSLLPCGPALSLSRAARLLQVTTLPPPRSQARRPSRSPACRPHTPTAAFPLLAGRELRRPPRLPALRFRALPVAAPPCSPAASFPGHKLRRPQASPCSLAASFAGRCASLLAGCELRRPQAPAAASASLLACRELRQLRELLCSWPAYSLSESRASGTPSMSSWSSGSPALHAVNGRTGGEREDGRIRLSALVAL